LRIFFKVKYQISFFFQLIFTKTMIIYYLFYYYYYFNLLKNVEFSILSLCNWGLKIIKYIVYELLSFNLLWHDLEIYINYLHFFKILVFLIYFIVTIIFTKIFDRNFIKNSFYNFNYEKRWKLLIVYYMNKARKQIKFDMIL